MGDPFDDSVFDVGGFSFDTGGGGGGFDFSAASSTSSKTKAKDKTPAVASGWDTGGGNFDFGGGSFGLGSSGTGGANEDDDLALARKLQEEFDREAAGQSTGAMSSNQQEEERKQKQKEEDDKEKKRQEKEREEEKKRKEEEARKHEEARKKEEKRKLEEEARKDEQEKRKLEEARKEEEKRKQEEELRRKNEHDREIAAKEAVEKEENDRAERLKRKNLEAQATKIKEELESRGAATPAQGPIAASGSELAPNSSRPVTSVAPAAVPAAPPAPVVNSSRPVNATSVPRHHDTVANTDQAGSSQKQPATSKLKKSGSVPVALIDRSGGYPLEITLVGGAAITDSTGKCDPYAKIKFQADLGVEFSFKTKTEKKTMAPAWNETFHFEKALQNDVIEILVYDWDRFSKDDYIGSVYIPLASLGKDQAIDKWYTLQKVNPKTGPDDDVIASGSPVCTPNSGKACVHIRLKYSCPQNDKTNTPTIQLSRSAKVERSEQQVMAQKPRKPMAQKPRSSPNPNHSPKNANDPHATITIVEGLNYDHGHHLHIVAQSGRSLDDARKKTSQKTKVVSGHLGNPQFDTVMVFEDVEADHVLLFSVVHTDAYNRDMAVGETLISLVDFIDGAERDRYFSTRVRPGWEVSESYGVAKEDVGLSIPHLHLNVKFWPPIKPVQADTDVKRNVEELLSPMEVIRKEVLAFEAHEKQENDQAKKNFANIHMDKPRLRSPDLGGDVIPLFSRTLPIPPESSPDVSPVRSRGGSPMGRYESVSPFFREDARDPSPVLENTSSATVGSSLAFQPPRRSPSPTPVSMERWNGTESELQFQLKCEKEVRTTLQKDMTKLINEDRKRRLDTAVAVTRVLEQGSKINDILNRLGGGAMPWADVPSSDHNENVPSSLKGNRRGSNAVIHQPPKKLEGAEIQEALIELQSMQHAFITAAQKLKEVTEKPLEDSSNLSPEARKAIGDEIRRNRGMDVNLRMIEELARKSPTPTPESVFEIDKRLQELRATSPISQSTLPVQYNTKTRAETNAPRVRHNRITTSPRPESPVFDIAEVRPKSHQANHYTRNSMRSTPPSRIWNGGASGYAKKPTHKAKAQQLKMRGPDPTTASGGISQPGRLKNHNYGLDSQHVHARVRLPSPESVITTGIDYIGSTASPKTIGTITEVASSRLAWRQSIQHQIDQHMEYILRG